jgi:hypothetical protein
MKTMEEIEGPRYQATSMTVRATYGQEFRATTFLVKKNSEATGLWTSKDYVEHIVTGLRDAPPEYVEHVIAVAIAHNDEAQSIAGLRIDSNR